MKGMVRRAAPHMGNIPMVIPSAAEKASCFGSAPLHDTPTEVCQQPFKHLQKIP
jgi:hypothetical protein